MAQRLDALTAARKAAGMTQAELAARCGMSVTQISELERGKLDVLNMTVGNLWAIADALHVDPQDIVGNRRKAKRGI